MEILVAVIGLVGAVLAGGAVTELAKSYNSRAKILKDLEIWTKLPNGPAKDAISKAISDRVIKNTMSQSWASGLLLGFFGWTAVFILTFVERGVKFRRDDSGLLRLVGTGLDVSFLNTAAFYVIGLLLSVFLFVVGGRFAEWLGTRLAVLTTDVKYGVAW